MNIKYLLASSNTGNVRNKIDVRHKVHSLTSKDVVLWYTLQDMEDKQADMVLQ